MLPAQTPVIIVTTYVDTKTMAARIEATESDRTNTYLRPPVGRFKGIKNPWTDFSKTPFGLNGKFR